jgi:hypothetical protein
VGVKALKKLSFIVRMLCAAAAFTSIAAAAPPGSVKPLDYGPEINPYECLGRYEAATGNRSMTQVRAELDKRLNPLFEGPEPRTVRAMKACVVAMLKSRLGDSDAADYYEMAVTNDPEEPGYQYWYGRYYSGFRGARGVIVENAEDHFYKALELLDRKRAQGKFRPYHQVVEDWTHKQLMYSYQEDGVHFLPWAKAFPQHGYTGHDVPSVALSAQFHVSRDTRDFYRNNEARLFTGEMMFAATSYRGFTIDDGQAYTLARTPLRYRTDGRLRVRYNWLGAFDFSAAYEKCQGDCQVNSYYLVPGSTAPEIADRADGRFTPVNLREAGIGYERVFPLFPVMDFKLKGGVKYIDRQGVIEFQEFWHEKFFGYEVRPSFSRFIGPDKIDLDLIYVYLNITDVPFGVKSEALRDMYIRAASLEYAIYRPFTLPEFRHGSLGIYRAPTRGWYWTLGGADEQVPYGTKTVVRRDAYLATRFEGAGNWDMQLQGTYGTSDIPALDLNAGIVGEQRGAPTSSKHFRASGYLQYRIINPDAYPGISNRVVDLDMMHLVTPVSWDKGLAGSCVKPDSFAWLTKYTTAAECYKMYDNVRVGAELWTKFWGTGFGGPAFLSTIGYDYQYFYTIKKAIHNVHLNMRMGWDWHKL